MIRARVALGLLALSASAACGSTVQVSRTLGTSELGGQPVTATAGPDAGNLGAGAPSGSTSTGVGQLPRTGQAAGGSSSVASPRPSLGSGVTSTAGNAPGITATTVKLGVEYINAAALGSFGSAAGVKGTGSLDALSATKAVVAYVNSHGGAGGRKIVVVPSSRSTTETNSQAAQATCAAFSEDDHVFAANTYITPGGSAVDCLARRGVLSLAGGWPEAGSQKDFQRFNGLYLGPGTADTVAAAKAYVQGLVRQGFLTTHSKVGLLWFNFSDFQDARTNGVLPALKTAGIPLTTEFQSSYGGNPAELGSLASQMQNAALQFRAAGVDRVISLDLSGTLEYLFMTNAQSQQYQPKYGLASWSDPEFLRGNSPAAQLAGSTGIGWLSGYDVQVSQQPSTPAHQRCLQAMQQGGLGAPTAQTDVLVVWDACEVVFELTDLLNATKDLTPAGIRHAQVAQGTRPSYTGFTDTYAQNKLWGAGTYRDLAYGVSCSCFTYSGPERSF